MAGAAIWAVLSVAAGCLLAVQGPVNALLGRTVGSPFAAALISSLVTAAAAGTMLTMSGVGPNWREPQPWLYAAGGLLGVAVLLAGVTITPKLGASTFLACLIFGQLAAGLLLDHIGALGLEQHPVSFGRLCGVLCVLAGAVLLHMF